MIKFIILLLFLIPLIIQVIISYTKKKTVLVKDLKLGIIVGVIGLLFVLSLDQIVEFIINYIWFSDLGYLNIFVNLIFYRVAIFIVTFIVVLIGLIVFIYLPLKFFFPKFPLSLIKVKEFELAKLIEKFGKLTLILILIVVAGYFAYAASVYDWMSILKFFSRVETIGYSDPIFNLSAEFYMFSLPFTKTVFNNIMWFFFIISMSMFVILSIYLRFEHGYYSVAYWSSVFSGRMPDRIARGVYKYSIFMLILWFFTLGLRVSLVYPLDLIFTSNRLFVGLGYTETYAILPLLRISGILIILSSVISIIFLFRNEFLKIVVSYISVLSISILAIVVYSSIIENFVVKPSEMDRERPFIKNNIEATRVAYDLRNIEEKTFSYQILTKDVLEKNYDIVQDMRLWDWMFMRDAYQQIQAIRFYYRFNDVDIDRYVLQGRLRQVMLSARELDINALPGTSKTWVNTRFRYTHGIGVAVSPVNEVMENGMPKLFVRDIPPISSFPELSISQPRIYFGEITKDYVFVNSALEEFDYPSIEENKEENVFTRYEGSTGIKIDSFLKKVLVALFLNEDIKVLFSEYITPETKLLLWREIRERVSRIMPFFEYDTDPYIVISKGKLYWILDAYVTSDHFPYSFYINFEEPINYIRNPVKVVIDAYNGTVDFYVIDDKEPITKVFQKMLDIKFKDISEMDEDLRKHIRYPDDLFRIQAKVFAIYHMENPDTFFNQEDLWHISREVLGDKKVEVRPYYMVARLPGEPSTKFISVIPYTPKDKDNLIAWMSVVSDPDQYGRKIVFRMPKDKLVFGPLQIETRISQDPEISAQITLWNQQGSQVIRGNLIILPIENSLLYYEPIFLQASEAKMPEFRRIVLSSGDTIVWDSNLENAIKKLFSSVTIPYDKIEEIQTISPTTKFNSVVINQALKYLEEYKKLSGQGNFIEAGRKLKELEEFLKENRKE